MVEQVKRTMRTRLRTRYGFEADVSGYTVGEYIFVHREHLGTGGRWRLSHLPTGWVFPRLYFATLKNAITAARILAKCFDWSRVTPENKENKRTKAMREAGAAYVKFEKAKEVRALAAYSAPGET